MRFILEKALKKFPQSTILHLWLAQYFYYLVHNDMLADNAYKSCLNGNPIIDEDFAIYFMRQQHDIETMGDGKRDHISFYIKYHNVIYIWNYYYYLNY